ncbi:hypothetical protein LEN26_001562 [Aphanomyces euteiches]|nr:hypothetical protein AeMF1_001200 [Aphanomyces euteiches]KAH9161116.1 hypothetical protein LEN26_001562 [Aphanomyces euteiches]KAH9194535.1 hypothetical protein AeNC1_003502 [Aphanomyces euteiches]
MNESSTGEEMLSRFTEGVKQKIMATTNMNAASSRSHCIYTIYVESIDLENPELVTLTKLSLVDLAGSERIVKTGATGVTLQESIGINKSLFVLRQVIQILSDEASNNQAGHSSGGSKTYVPYRDSKLTSLLKHSLGGNSITVMVVCLSPSDLCYEENLSTLQYAARAQQISNTPVKNAGEAHKVLVQQLQDTIRMLKIQLSEANATIERLQRGRRVSSRNLEIIPPLVKTLSVRRTVEDNQVEKVEKAMAPTQTRHFVRDFFGADKVQRRRQWIEEEDALECGKEHMFSVHTTASSWFNSSLFS